MISYWEQTSFLKYDVLVIGAGVTGLSTAISLKMGNPELDVAILERGLIPRGASLRNAGFACMGSLGEVLVDLEQMGEDKLLALVTMRRDGLSILRSRLGAEDMGYRTRGSYELLGESDLGVLDRMDEVNDLLRPIFGGDAYACVSQKIGNFGFNEVLVKAMIRNEREGELDTGRMMRGLIRKARSEGIQILWGCRVKEWKEESGRVLVETMDPSLLRAITLSASRVAVCTNAFTGELLSGVDLVPGRGQVLITEPVQGLKFKGIFHFEQGYYYFREIDGRVLLGGGRNLDFEGEQTTDAQLNDRIQQDLEGKLATLILPGKKTMIAGRWAGVMAFGTGKMPLIGRHAPRIYLGVRMGGMGIAIGSEVGRRLADLILQDEASRSGGA